MAMTNQANTPRSPWARNHGGGPGTEPHRSPAVTTGLVVYTATEEGAGAPEPVVHHVGEPTSYGKAVTDGEINSA